MIITKIFFILLTLTIATHIAIKLIALTFDKKELALMLATNRPPLSICILAITLYILSALTTVCGVLSVIIAVCKL